MAGRAAWREGAKGSSENTRAYNAPHGGRGAVSICGSAARARPALTDPHPKDGSAGATPLS